MVRLFREPEQGEVIAIGADPADGGSDYCAAQAISQKHHDVFMVFQERMESAQFGHEIYKMGQYIKKKTGDYPSIAVERNIGAATIQVLQNYNFPYLYRMKRIGRTDDKEEDRIGFSMNTATRPMVLDNLSLALRQQAIRIYDKETVIELMSFIRNERSGKPEAVAGSHDDLVMSLAIALHTVGDIQRVSVLDKRGQFRKQVLFDEQGIPNV